MGAKIFIAVISLCLLALVAACGAEPSTKGPASPRAHSTTDVASSRALTTGASTQASSSSSSVEVFFPKLRKVEVTLLVVAQGEFFVDDDGCLRVDDVGARGDLGFVPLWTPQYELESEGDGIRVVDKKGHTVARVGEKVHMGGGAIGRKDLEEHAFLDERTMRELFERCSGKDYWLVSDRGVNLLSQE
jgi:hypothetical protein